MTPGERVKEIRKALGLTLDKFGEKLGVTKQTVSRIENDINNLTDQMLKGICREYKVNEEWLRNGTGEMFFPEPTDELQALVERYELSSADRILIEKFLALKPESRDAVIRFIEDVSAALNSDGLYERIPSEDKVLGDRAFSNKSDEFKNNVG